MNNKIPTWMVIMGLLMVLLFTVKHAVIIYHYAHTGNGDYELLSWQTVYTGLMMLAIDLAIVLFAMAGLKNITILFAFLVGMLNLFYFWHDLPALPARAGFYDYVPFIPGAVLSGMFAGAQYGFTEIFIAQQERSDELQAALDQSAEYERKWKEALRKLAGKDQEQAQGRAEAEALLDAAIRQLADATGNLKNKPENLERNARNWRRRLAENHLSEAERAEARVTLRMYEFAKAQVIISN